MWSNNPLFNNQGGIFDKITASVFDKQIKFGGFDAKKKMEQEAGNLKDEAQTLEQAAESIDEAPEAESEENNQGDTSTTHEIQDEAPETETISLDEQHDINAIEHQAELDSFNDSLNEQMAEMSNPASWGWAASANAAAEAGEFETEIEQEAPEASQEVQPEMEAGE